MSGPSPLATIAVTGSVLFFGQQGMGVDVGAMGRLAVFPLTIWTACIGVRIATTPALPINSAK